MTERFPLRGTTAGLALVLAAACATAPPPERYLLPVPPASTGAGETLRVALQRVGVPGYLESDRIASAAPGPRVVFAENDRWAEDPRIAVTRALQGTLAAQPGLVVLSEPWPRRFEPDIRLRIDFDRFLRTEEGGVSIAGNVIVTEGDSETVRTIRPFAITRGGGTALGYEGFFRATSEALDALAAEIARTLPSDGDTA